jgi:hypothetical protein
VFSETNDEYFFSRLLDKKISVSRFVMSRNRGQSELAAEIHERRPVIVHPDDWQAWLAGELSFATKGMTARCVSTPVNNSWHEGAECTASAA